MDDYVTYILIGMTEVC